LDDQNDKDIPEQPLENPDPDPINASGDFYFKRFDTESRETEPDPKADDREDVIEVLMHSESPEVQRARAALTITIQSWATPVIGLVMLVFGLLGGYFLRPLITPAGGTGSLPDETTSTGTQTQSSPEDREALMAALIPGVRHFSGNPAAPITLIEFSDFQ
jgi:hypothetical protein